MHEVSREQLHAYLDDSLDDVETARIEKQLRTSEELQTLLKIAREERDRGEHSLGAIWRRERLSCLTREQLNAYLHSVLPDDLAAYADFHLQTIACLTCSANLEDLREKQAETNVQAKRRRRYFENSAKLLDDRK